MDAICDESSQSAVNQFGMVFFRNSDASRVNVTMVNSVLDSSVKFTIHLKTCMQKAEGFCNIQHKRYSAVEGQFSTTLSCRQKLQKRARGTEFVEQVMGIGGTIVWYMVRVQAHQARMLQPL